MEAEHSKPLSAFGFLTVLETPEHGAFGGYLVLSPQGRPLEFRCTTPVAPTRAQEILYGATLRPYLLAEVIGPALMASAELSVRAVLTDVPELLALSLTRPEPVYLLAASREPQLASERNGDDQSLETQSLSCNCAGCMATVATHAAAELESVVELLAPISAHIHLLEPFDRIRTALAEAQAASPDEPAQTDELRAA
jgi:hypothetical protein